MATTQDRVTPTHLIRPSLPAGLIPRARLHALLDDPSWRLAVITAPAGFGKTALVVDWLERTTAQHAWLSIDRYDNDPVRFFNHLAAAVATLPSDAAARAAPLLRTLGQRSGPAPDVQEAIASLGPDTVLVLDDVHELEEGRVLDGLARLLEAAGTGPRVVMLTRVDPPFPFARMRVSGALREIREGDLRFTADECGRLLAGLLPSELPSALVEQILRRTEGWAAGLRMAAIVLRDAPDPGAAVRSFAGTHRIVADYLVEEAIGKRSERVQRFLMDTSVLDRFTPETCSAVCDEPDATAVLDEIESANLFLVPLGTDRRWYRYHHLFGELLRFRLERLRPGRAEELHRRASTWFERAGDMDAAVEHACRMEDRARLLELLDAHAFDVIKRSELATLRRWIEHVPAPLSQPYPILLAAIGWLRVLTRRAPDLEPVLGAIESALGRVGPDYDPERRRRAIAQLGILRGYEARFAGRLDEALEVSRAVLGEIPEGEVFSRGLVTYNLARVQSTLGEMHEASTLFEDSFALNLKAGTPYLLLTGFGQAATVRAQVEGVPAARDTLRIGLAFAEEHHLTGLPAYSAVLYHRANIEYLADRLDEAQEACERALELGRPDAFPEGYGNGLVIAARIATARGRLEDAAGLLTEAAAQSLNRNMILLDTTIPLERARLALADGVPGDPFGPLGGRSGGASWDTFAETETLLRVRHALAEGNTRSARELLSLLRRESERRGRGVALSVALVAEAMLPDCEDRWTALDEGLRFAAAREYARPIVDLGEPAREVLQAALNRPLSVEARAWAGWLLERFVERDGRARHMEAVAPVEALTPREEEILSHLFAGLSNKAMARAMFISTETVKTHLKHLYAKLGAADRGGAVARARALGLHPDRGR